MSQRAIRCAKPLNNWSQRTALGAATEPETNETFYLDLFGNSSDSLFTKNPGVGMILNDD